MAETTEQYRARINQLKTSIENEPYMKNMRPDIAEGISKTGNRQADIEVQFQSVIDGTTGKDVISAPEIIAARNGEVNLNARLDKEKQEVTAQLAQKAEETTTKNLQSQINTLVVNGTNDGNNPEILQARVDNNGTVFPTLKTRIDNTEENLKLWKTEIVFDDWEVGSFNSFEGTPSFNTGRLRNSQYHSFNSNVLEIEPSSGYKVGVYIYLLKNDKYEFQGNTGLTSENMTLKLLPNSAYKFLIGKNDDSEAVDDFKNNVKIKVESLPNEINASRVGIDGTVFKNINERINVMQQKIENDTSILVFDDWEVGTFRGTGDNDDVSKNRMRSSQHHFLHFDKVKIKPEVGYKCGYYRYSLNTETGLYTFVDRLTMQTNEFELTPSNYYYKFLIATDTDVVFIENISDKVLIIGEPKNMETENQINKYVGTSFDFSLTNSCLDMSPNSDTPLVNFTSDQILEKFDKLISEYPSIISKKQVGLGGDSNGNPDSAYPIYEYHVKLQRGTEKSGLLDNAPTILISCGVHGNEKASVWGVYQLLTQIFNGHVGFDAITANCELKIIPVLNRYGFDNNTRNNAENVDINRSFEYLTTQESIVLNNWTNNNLDALAFIDYHNTANFGWYSYLTSHNTNLRIMYSSLIRQLATIWLNSYHFNLWEQEKNDERFVFSKSPAEFGSTDFTYKKGIKNSLTLEVGNYDPLTNASYSKTVIEVAVDSIANTLLSLLRIYYK